MRIHSVSVQGFRSLRDLSWGSSRNLLAAQTVILGENSVGKSNLFRFVDLLLNRAPASASPRKIDHIEFQAEGPKVAYLGGGETPVIQGNIALERSRKPFLLWLKKLSTTFTTLTEEQIPEEEQRILSLFIRQVEKNIIELIQVQIWIELREVDATTGRVVANFSEIQIDGESWFRDGAVSHTELEDLHGLRVRFDRALLNELTSGFIRIDCPRVLKNSEVLIPPTIEERLRLLPRPVPPWQDLIQNNLNNAIYWAGGDPWGTHAVQKLSSKLSGKDDLSVRHWVEQSSDEVTHRLQLILSDGTSPGRFNELFWLPAKSMGTGFEQLLHIISALYLSDSTVIAIEELEANLSPESQHWIWNELEHMITDPNFPLAQVFITSHSPSFLLANNDQMQIWYASMGEDRSTSLQLMKEKEDAVAKQIYNHFFPLEEPFWMRFAPRWPVVKRMQLDNDENTLRRILISDGPPSTIVDTAPSEQQKHDLAGMSAGQWLRFVFIQRLELVEEGQRSTLAKTLALGEWLGDQSLARLRVEWTQREDPSSSLYPFEIFHKVEAQDNAGDGLSKYLLLYIEARAQHEDVDVSEVIMNWSDIYSLLDDKLIALALKLRGN